MKGFLAGFLLAIAATGALLVTHASAQTAAPTGTRMVMATLVCRPTQAGESAGATSAAGDTLICKTFDPKPVMALKPMVMSQPSGEPKWLQALNSFNFELHQ
jgi:hypothetical protein